MKQVNMHEAKTHLSRLVELVLAGEEVVIARRDRPLVRLTPITEPGTGRKIGALPDLIGKMGNDFNAPLEDWDEALVPNRRPGHDKRPKRGRKPRL